MYPSNIAIPFVSVLRIGTFNRLSFQISLHFAPAMLSDGQFGRFVEIFIFARASYPENFDSLQIDRKLPPFSQFNTVYQNFELRDGNLISKTDLSRNKTVCWQIWKVPTLL